MKRQTKAQLQKLVFALRDQLARADQQYEALRERARAAETALRVIRSVANRWVEP